MRDVFEFESALRLVEALVLAPHFRRLLVRRNQTIKRLADSAEQCAAEVSCESTTLSRQAILPTRSRTATISAVPKDDALVYRTEVLAIMGALSDLVVDVRAIREWLEGDDEEEEDQERS
jgi:hypothetical protein